MFLHVPHRSHIRVPQHRQRGKEFQNMAFDSFCPWRHGPTWSFPFGDHFGWSSQDTSRAGLKCIQLSFQTLSTHLKPPGAPTRQQALNIHFDTATVQNDVDLLWFAQMYYECGSLAQICADVFLGSMPHKDIGRGEVMRVAGCSKLACLTGSWNNFFHKFQRGLSGMHPDKSAASICQLKQWRSQQPSCLDYIVLADRLPVMTAIWERSVTATGEGSPLVQLKQPATQILTALLLQQRRWDRPLGTVHFATVKCQLSHAINPPSCGKKGGGHKNVRVNKTLRCVSRRKLARKQSTGIPTRKLALCPRKWRVSGGASNSLRPCEWKTFLARLSWFSNLPPSKSKNLEFTQWDECSFSVRSGQIFWTFGGCHHIRLLQPRVNAAWQILHSGMPN